MKKDHIYLVMGDGEPFIVLGNGIQSFPWDGTKHFYRNQYDFPLSLTVDRVFEIGKL